MELGKASLVPLLDGLVREGWVRRVVDPGDRRVKRIYLTEKVAPVLDRMNAAGAEVVGFCVEDGAAVQMVRPSPLPALLSFGVRDRARTDLRPGGKVFSVALRDRPPWDAGRPGAV